MCLFSYWPHDAHGRRTEIRYDKRGRYVAVVDAANQTASVEYGDNNALMAQLTRDGNIGGVLSRKAGAVTSFFGYDGNGNVTLKNTEDRKGRELSTEFAPFLSFRQFIQKIRRVLNGF